MGSATIDGVVYYFSIDCVNDTPVLTVQWGRANIEYVYPTTVSYNPLYIVWIISNVFNTTKTLTITSDMSCFGSSSSSSGSQPSQSSVSHSSVSQQSTSTTQGTISIACCPNLLPASLTLTLAGIGGCAVYSGSYTLTWNSGAWQYVSGDLLIVLNCMGSDYSGFLLNITCMKPGGGIMYSGFAASGSCSPLTLTFSTPGSGGANSCCIDGFSSVTIA